MLVAVPSSEIFEELIGGTKLEYCGKLKIIQFLKQKEKSFSSSNLFRQVQRNAQSIYTYLGLETFRRRSKRKSKQPLNVVTLLSNRVLSLPPDSFSLQPRKMYCLLLTKAILFTNTCATVIVGTWAVLPKDCSRESRSMCRNLFEVGTLFKIEPHWPVPVSQPNPSTPKFLHQRLDNISYITNYAHKTIQMINFPYLHMAEQLSIFQLLKLLISKHQNLICVSKKNSYTA